MNKIFATLKSDDYEQNVRDLLESEFCSHRLRVEFALMCAKDSFPLLDKEKYPKTYETNKACLELIEKWLAEPEKVSKLELEKAADKAYSATYLAAYTAASATNAATYAAYVATYAAVYAAANATYAANAAYWAVEAFNDKAKWKEYYQWLFERMTKGMDKEVIRVLYGD